MELNLFFSEELLPRTFIISYSICNRLFHPNICILFFLPHFVFSTSMILIHFSFLCTRYLSLNVWCDCDIRGGGYSSEFLVGVCRPVPQILIQFQTKIFRFPHPFSDLDSKIHTHFQTFVVS